jgi:hypothetical protein
MGVVADMLYFEDGVLAVADQTNLGWRVSGAYLLGP